MSILNEFRELIADEIGDTIEVSEVTSSLVLTSTDPADNHKAFIVGHGDMSISVVLAEGNKGLALVNDLSAQEAYDYLVNYKSN